MPVNLEAGSLELEIARTFRRGRQRGEEELSFDNGVTAQQEKLAHATLIDQACVFRAAGHIGLPVDGILDGDDIGLLLDHKVRHRVPMVVTAIRGEHSKRARALPDRPMEYRTMGAPFPERSHQNAHRREAHPGEFSLHPP